MGNDWAMPLGWTRIPSSPRTERRDNVHRIVSKPEYRPAALIGGHLYWDDADKDYCYALLKLPRPDKERALLDELSKPGQSAEILIRLTDTDGN